MKKHLPLLIALCIGYTLRPQIDSVIHPVPTAPPVAIVKAQEPTSAPPVTRTPTPTPVVQSVVNLTEKVVQFIWNIESGRGKAKTGWAVNCRAIGKWNEIGFGGPDFCFDNEEQGFKTLRSEIEQRLAKNGLLETLCVYNLGYNRDESGKRIPHTTCDYYQSFLNTL